MQGLSLIIQAFCYGRLSICSAWSATSQYLSQCWNIVNCTHGNKLRWKLYRNSNIFVQENEFESVVHEMRLFRLGLNVITAPRYQVISRRNIDVPIFSHVYTVFSGNISFSFFIVISSCLNPHYVTRETIGPLSAGVSPDAMLTFSCVAVIYCILHFFSFRGLHGKPLFTYWHCICVLQSIF